MASNDETLIIGQAAVAEFLTKNGYPISRMNLSRLSSLGEGPPAAQMWGNALCFSPAVVLAWAKERARARLEKQLGRVRKADAPADAPQAIADCDDLAPPV